MPQARVELRIYSPQTGDLQAVITTWRALNLVKTLNSFDYMTLSFDESDPNTQYFTLDAIIEVRRRLSRPGAQWYTESTLLHRTSSHLLESNGARIFVSYSRGLNDLLHRRKILYFANTAFTLKSGPGETVMKEIVSENAGPLANASGTRRVSWTSSILGLSLEADQARGLDWSGALTWKNVLEMLSEIAIKTGVDFNIERTGPRTFLFKCFYPQFGTDRSAIITFSPELNNMRNINYTKSRTEEANAIVALGQGERSARQTYPILDLASQDSPWNLIEEIRDARNEPTVTELINTAETGIKELKAQDSFTFDVIQTDSRQYGLDGEYWFGDIVKANYIVTVTRKIVGVTLNVAEGVEDIRLEFSEYPTPIS